ncbi:hypothetical protein AC579_10576 [Pseudocercospora musae]|uniref:Uncharacterized protein n=1 Tax=Pseudocercospora musae TaxID=113226 RepID=A0A139GT20_9PEZI|nr:hypothetical protein AC579_10576 [Pseudocercospora musae]
MSAKAWAEGVAAAKRLTRSSSGSVEPSTPAVLADFTGIPPTPPPSDISFQTERQGQDEDEMNKASTPECDASQNNQGSDRSSLHASDDVDEEEDETFRPALSWGAADPYHSPRKRKVIRRTFAPKARPGALDQQPPPRSPVAVRSMIKKPVSRQTCDIDLFPRQAEQYAAATFHERTPRLLVASNTGWQSFVFVKYVLVAVIIITTVSLLYWKTSPLLDLNMMTDKLWSRSYSTSETLPDLANYRYTHISHPLARCSVLRNNKVSGVYCIPQSPSIYQAQQHKEAWSGRDSSSSEHHNSLPSHTTEYDHSFSQPDTRPPSLLHWSSLYPEIQGLSSRPKMPQEFLTLAPDLDLKINDRIDDSQTFAHLLRYNEYIASVGSLEIFLQIRQLHQQSLARLFEKLDMRSNHQVRKAFIVLSDWDHEEGIILGNLRERVAGAGVSVTRAVWELTWLERRLRLRLRVERSRILEEIRHVKKNLEAWKEFVSAHDEEEAEVEILGFLSTVFRPSSEEEEEQDLAELCSYVVHKVKEAAGIVKSFGS